MLCGGMGAFVYDIYLLCYVFFLTHHYADPVICVPCVYFIGLDGKPLEMVVGDQSAEKFKEILLSAQMVSCATLKLLLLC